MIKIQRHCRLFGLTGIVALVIILTVDRFYNNSSGTLGKYIEIQQKLQNLANVVGHTENETSLSTGPKKPITTSPVNSVVAKTRQQEAERQKILNELKSLSLNELNQIRNFRNSFNDPSAVPKIRTEQALQSLQVNIIEEVSKSDIKSVMEAARNGEPLSSYKRPKPLQMIIATTWRSGSTFLEELLASHPGMYNHYEPLFQFGLHQVREESQNEAEAKSLVMDLLSCQYKNPNYMAQVKKLPEMISRNKRLYKACHTKEYGSALCYNTKFLENACNLYPWSTMKIVRLRLGLLRQVLQKDSLNVNVIFLVRDPRGVMNSRTATVEWCNTADCNDPASVCNDMENDLNNYLLFRDEFPNRVHIIRYEDLSLNPKNETMRLLNEIGLDYDSAMETFINTHTTKDFDKPWSTSRESAKRVTYWTTKLNLDRLKKIQDACQSIMPRLGYKLVESMKDLKVKDILEPLKL